MPGDACSTQVLRFTPAPAWCRSGDPGQRAGCAGLASTAQERPPEVLWPAARSKGAAIHGPCTDAHEPPPRPGRPATALFRRSSGVLLWRRPLRPRRHRTGPKVGTVLVGEHPTPSVPRRAKGTDRGRAEADVEIGRQVLQGRGDHPGRADNRSCGPGVSSSSPSDPSLTIRPSQGAATAGFPTQLSTKRAEPGVIVGGEALGAVGRTGRRRCAGSTSARRGPRPLVDTVTGQRWSASVRAQARAGDAARRSLAPARRVGRRGRRPNGSRAATSSRPALLRGGPGADPAEHRLRRSNGPVEPPAQAPQDAAIAVRVAAVERVAWFEVDQPVECRGGIRRPAQHLLAQVICAGCCAALRGRRATICAACPSAGSAGATRARSSSSPTL